jgi:hypothetical protein
VLGLSVDATLQLVEAKPASGTITLSSGSATIAASASRSSSHADGGPNNPFTVKIAQPA